MVHSEMYCDAIVNDVTHKIEFKENIEDLIKRILPKIKVSKVGCWEWLGRTVKDGYGNINVNKKRISIHRILYKYYHGKLDSELEIDHICRNRVCCNPLHLEQVTHKENVLRGFSLNAINARKTLCIRGHSLSGDNIRIEKYGSRRCKKCKNENQMKRRKQKRGFYL